MSALQTLPHVTERTNTKPRRRILLAMLALGVAVPLAACAGGAQESVSGTITTRERVVMPPDAVLVVRLLDATRGDMAAYTMVEQRLVANPLPARFELRYRYGDINPSGTYYVQAQIEQGGRVLYINDQNYSVLTRNSPYRNVLVNLIPAAGTMMVPSSSMAPATSTTTTTVIQTTPSAPVPPTTIILPGGSVVTPR
ncbi:YbaY family lipoprotein [Ferrovibrio sp.]|uniref:YbaY family lipoprotein n=1 Tax=Ferrovibrio sp. TaxID=1917215 RepID=UPI001B475C47|nr:YbaY family lipoprotein [Ferrovibrio sp.]MBP7064931.1 YbaY family lipoprotein [Ferrovibrio sp.]